MKITVCIGSSCHLKGSRQVVEKLQELIAEKELAGKIELAGTFCMGKCQNNGVNVCIDQASLSVLPDGVQAFFENDVLSRLR